MPNDFYQSAVLIGGQGSVSGEFAYDWAKPVLMYNDRQMLRVEYYAPDGLPEGDFLNMDEWNSLLRRGEVFRIDGNVPAVPNGMLWIFRPAFFELWPDANLAGGIKACGHGPLEIPAPNKVFWVDENKAMPYLDAQRYYCFSMAKDLGVQDENWALAHRYASLAFDLSKRHGVVEGALLVITARMSFDYDSSSKYIADFQKSRGDDFVDIMESLALQIIIREY